MLGVGQGCSGAAATDGLDDGKRTAPIKHNAHVQLLLFGCREFGIHAIYSGHDHDNDFAVELEGVRLAYGRKTG